MEDSEEQGPDAVTQDADVAAADLAPPDDATTDLEPVALAGFPRRGDPRRVRRLFQTPKSETFVEIKIADIVDAPSEIDDLEPGEIVIWVRGDAEVLVSGYPVSEWAARPPWPRRR